MIIDFQSNASLQKQVDALSNKRETSPVTDQLEKKINELKKRVDEQEKKVDSMKKVRISHTFSLPVDDYDCNAKSEDTTDYV